MLWSSLASCRHSVTAAAGSLECSMWSASLRAAFNICIILPWVNMKLRFILSEGWLLIAPSALYITVINTSSCPCWQLPHRFKFDFATANHWLKGTWNIYFNKILSTEWHEERKHQGYFCFWNLDPLAAAVIWDGELEAAADWLQTLNDMTAWGLLIAPSHQ